MNGSESWRRRLVDQLAERVPTGLVRIGSLGLADQVIISATNFFLMVVAARSLGPVAFGLFALLRTVMYFGTAFQNSLITTPHNVLGSQKDVSEYPRYTSTVAMLNLIMAATLAAVLLLALMTVEIVGDTVETMMLAMILASVSGQLHDFARGVLYTEQRIGTAFRNEIITNGVRVALIIGLVMSVGLTGERIFLAMAATWLLGALLGTWNIRRSLRYGFNREVIREHWVFGRWLFAGAGVSQLPSYVMAAAMSALLGVGAYGAYRAVTQIMRGFDVPLQAMTKVLRPYLSRRAENGHRAVWQAVSPIMAIGAFVLLSIATVLIFVREELMGFVYGDEFVPFAAIVFLVMLTPAFAWQREMLALALQASRNTRPLFTGTVVGVAAGIVVGVGALAVFGMPAAGASGLTIALVSSGWLWLAWHREMAEEEG